MGADVFINPSILQVPFLSIANVSTAYFDRFSAFNFTGVTIALESMYQMLYIIHGPIQLRMVRKAS